MPVIEPDRTSFSFWDEHGPRIVGLVVFVLALAALPEHAVPGYDLRSGLYLSTGVGFARGLGAVFAHLPDAPGVEWFLAGYSYVLSVMIRMWPEMPQGLTLIQLFNALCLGGAAWGLSAWGRTLAFPYVWLDAALVLMFAAPAVVSLPGNAVPEPMLAVLTVFALVSARRGLERWPHAAMAGLAAGLAAVTHVLGFVVVAGVLVEVARGPSRRTLLVAAAGALLPFIPWVWWSLLITTGDSGAAALSLGLGGDAVSARTMLFTVAGGAGGLFGAVLSGLLLVCAARGLMATAASARGATVVVAGWIVLVLAWPNAPGDWAVMLAPFAVFMAAVGARRFWGMQTTARIPVAVVCVVWFGVQAWGALGGLRATMDDEAQASHRNLHRALASMRNELPPDAVILSDADAAVFMYTNRRTLPLSVSPPVTATLCASGATHLAVVRRTDLPADLAGARSDSTLVRLFDLTAGPSLYRISCP